MVVVLGFMPNKRSGAQSHIIRLFISIFYSVSLFFYVIIALRGK